MQSSTELVEYDKTEIQDILMMHWFALLGNTHELEKLFLPEYWSLSKFFAHIVTLDIVFKADEDGIWFWASYAPILAGAQFDMWIRPDRRYSKACVEAMGEALERGFMHWPVLIGMTTQENLLDAHKRMGYNIVGKIPGLWEGKDTWIMHITKETFDAREAFVVRRAS
jgi:hypothetical protein